MSRHADFARLREFLLRHGVVCQKDSGHCRCLACMVDEVASDAVLTAEEAGAVYHMLTRQGVSSVADPVLYALRSRLSARVRLQEQAKPQPFAWRVP